MSRSGNILKNIDWVTIAMFFALTIFGWINIYSATYSFDESSIFDFSNRAGKQFVWIISAIIMGGLLLLIDSKSFDLIAYVVYAVWLIVLLVTPFLARDIKGSRSWLTFGPLSLQPAEFAKCFTALAIAKYMSSYDWKPRRLIDFLVPILLIVFPMGIIMVLQKETGSALVFAAFFLMFYREGMTEYILLIGAVAVTFFIIVIKFGHPLVPLGMGDLGIAICMLSLLIIEIFFLIFKLYERSQAGVFFRYSGLGLFGLTVFVTVVSFIVNIWVSVHFGIVYTTLVGISLLYLIFLGIRWRRKEIYILLMFIFFSMAYCYSCNYAFQNILKEHQRARIEQLLGLRDDPSGIGYNVNQAKIAIGSGGFCGKGYLKGTQTKLQFVPEQATDFIFCTVGEEWGFFTSSILLIVYAFFILRLIQLAERQKDRFSRIYGYSIASIFFMHVVINIGMVIGILPVIGIPLPFFSYGGSSLWGFTIMLFIFLKLDASRFDKM